MITQSREQGEAMKHDTNVAAVDRFIEKNLDILDMLDRIRLAAQDHWGVPPEVVSWDHVGSLGHVKELLQNVIDFKRIK